MCSSFGKNEGWASLVAQDSGSYSQMKESSLKDEAFELVKPCVNWTIFEHICAASLQPFNNGSKLRNLSFSIQKRRCDNPEEGKCRPCFRTVLGVADCPEQAHLTMIAEPSGDY